MIALRDHKDRETATNPVEDVTHGVSQEFSRSGKHRTISRTSYDLTGSPSRPIARRWPTSTDFSNKIDPKQRLP